MLRISWVEGVNNVKLMKWEDKERKKENCYTLGHFMRGEKYQILQGKI